MAERIPSRIYLPFGFIVKVKLVPMRVLREINAEEHGEYLGAWIHEGGDGLGGTIYLYNRQTTRQKRDTLYHELQHAIVDAKDWFLKTGVAKTCN